MAWRFVTVEKKDRIAVIRFERGDDANALSFDLIRELTEAARSFEDDTETSAIILSSRGPNFTLGFDLNDALTERRGDLSLAEKRVLWQLGPKLCRAFENLEPMTLAAIEGWCVGGGVALVVACDLRVIGRGAHMYVSEIERGMNMAWQSVPRITALVGPARAKRAIVMAERIDAQTSVDWGLADEIAPDGEVFDRAMTMAQRIASLPPVQVRMCKRGINTAAHALSDAVSYMDVDQFMLALTSEDYAEGVESFMEKRPPRYTGR